jgi:hypothetical protein
LVEAPASALAEAGEVVGSSVRFSWCLIVAGDIIFFTFVK